LVSGVFLLVLCHSAAFGQDKAATPAEKYQALLQNGPDALSNATTDEERKRIQGELSKLPRRFLELAEENPNDPVALDALIQTVSLVNGTAFPDGGKDSPGTRALALLRRDHLRSEKLGVVCQRVFFGFHKSHELFLRSVLDANPHRPVQALACLSLAQYLNDRRNRLELLASQDLPESAERYSRVFGKEYLEELQRQDRASATKEMEMLFDRAASDYRDVEIPVTYYGSGGTVGEKADAELFQIRHLAVGKQAPDIEGSDQDGKHFKLTDYRGKVVLLDFWHRL
jgi:hypothetical protein